MPLYNEVFERNKKWVAEMTAGKADYFEEMAKGQSPEFLFIGCSDSRMPANQIMGLAPGDVFVHRNVSNIVTSSDLNALSVINYAVAYLHVKHIIVCGHYGCGGVKAAMSNQDFGVLNPWLSNVKDVYLKHKEELNDISDEHKRYDRLVELNVAEQCRNIMKLGSVQEDYVANNFPTVHGWVYDLKTGFINDLNLDFEKMLAETKAYFDVTGGALKGK